jgi:hypothetical protein
VTRCGMDLARIDEGGVTGSWETGAGIKNVRHVHMHGVRQMAVGGIRGCMVWFGFVLTVLSELSLLFLETSSF